ncbi:MAG: heat-inducible transcriptional repressor HrcA [Mycoplasmataceae bacterium]|nr:heat-inducible transcriptional repressor HrcA [Mycoplasmataceae bacterium]
MKQNDRLDAILKAIIEEYTHSPIPLSSELIQKKYFIDLSPQTIRNCMAELEKKGFLEKTHISSGRIPSINGYKYYESKILVPIEDKNIKNKLMKIFQNRNLSIDTIIDHSTTILQETFKLPIVISKRNEDERMKRFDLIQLSEKEALIILVTSSKEIIKNTITFNQKSQFDDIAICIRVFNDRLIDTKISELNEKLIYLKEIIKNAVHEYEFCIQQIVEKIFDFNKIKVFSNEIKGTSLITSQTEFKDIEKMNQILSLLEDTNVWKHIAFNQERSGKTNITFGDEIGRDSLAIASTTISLKDENKQQLSIIGPVRMDYAKVQGLLNFIKKEIEDYLK